VRKDGRLQKYPVHPTASAAWHKHCDKIQGCQDDHLHKQKRKQITGIDRAMPKGLRPRGVATPKRMGKRYQRTRASECSQTRAGQRTRLSLQSRGRRTLFTHTEPRHPDCHARLGKSRWQQWNRHVDLTQRECKASTMQIHCCNAHSRHGPHRQVHNCVPVVKKAAIASLPKSGCGLSSRRRWSSGVRFRRRTIRGVCTDWKAGRCTGG
jgi:hypothetical protein